MKRITVTSIAIAAVLALGAAACAKDPSKDAPKAEVKDAPPEKKEAPRAPDNTGNKAGDKVAPRAPGVAAALPAGPSYVIAPETSTITWTGSKVTGKHDGGFKAFSGTIALADPSKPESAQVSVEIQTASIFTDNEKLAGHLKSKDFFEVDQFPTATFTSTGVQPGGAGGATHTITGNLALHGVTKSVTFPATIMLQRESVVAKAEFSINRKDWGLVYAGMRDDLIREGVVIRLDLKAPKGK